MDEPQGEFPCCCTVGLIPQRKRRCAAGFTKHSKISMMMQSQKNVD